MNARTQKFNLAIQAVMAENIRRYFEKQTATMPQILENRDKYCGQFAAIIRTVCRQWSQVVDTVSFVDGQFVAIYTVYPEDTDFVIGFLEEVGRNTGYRQVDIIHEEYTEQRGILTVQYSPF